MNKTIKRKYEKKIVVGLLKEGSKKFLIEKLKREWQQIEKSKKRKEFLDKTKSAGITIGKILLALLLVGGVITVTSVAPNIFAAVGRQRNRRFYFEKEKFKEEVAYLRKKEYIKLERNKERNIKEIRLTENGAKIIFRDLFSKLKIPRPERWDGAWRIVIFDIPNRHKWARDGFRQRLNEIGFYQLQESVFIFPFPCFKEINFLTSIFNIQNYIYFIETKYLSNDKEIKKYFSKYFSLIG